MTAAFIGSGVVSARCARRYLVCPRPRRHLRARARRPRVCMQGPNKDKEARVDVWLRQVRESYEALPRQQQFYVQCVYLAFVISGFVSVGATMVRIYAALHLASEFGA